MKRNTAIPIASLVEVLAHLNVHDDILTIVPTDNTFCNQPSVHVHSLWGIAPSWDWNIDQRTVPQPHLPYRAWITLHNIAFYAYLSEEEYQHAMRQIARHQKQTEGPPPWETSTD